jgi:hypothetical protein
MVERAAFKDFIICKALDVISGNGAYRKYLHQCCENGEEWAQRVTASVAAVNQAIKELHTTVDRVRRLPNSKVGKACCEIVFSMHAPVRVIPGWSTCFITECQAQNCIDVSRATKQNQSLPVHPKFGYFVLMLFYTHRIEHVIRTYTKLWLEAQPPQADMNELTTKFQEQTEIFDKMYDRFSEGYAHVKTSLEAYLCER